MTTNKQHNRTGASLALVAVCAGLIIILLIACFQMAMIMGGLQELNYTADAAALNIAKRSMEIKTNPSPLYSDCADSSGSVGLANINRVWGKAYLINANVEQMVADQQSTSAAAASGDGAYTLAQAMNTDLFGRINNHPTLFSFFNQIASLRFLKMFGNAPANSSTQTDWSTSSVYRGDTSNLSFTFNQIPGPANTHCPSVGTDSAVYMQGYTAIQANDKPFYFVAFHPNEMPHLISETFFKQNRLDENSIANINNPLPNAFSAYGWASNSMGSHAYAIANPQRQYNLSIPHAFASINLTNTAFWIVQGKQVNVTSYGFVPETQWGAQHIPLGRGNNNLLDGYASLGNEFAGNTLWDAINSVKGDPTEAVGQLLQKIQEIKGDFTQNNLQQLLQQQTLLPNVNNYLIYPKYTSPDNTNPNMQIAPVSAKTIKGLPGWVNAAASNEGQSKTLLSEQPTQDQPNYDWQMVTGGGFRAGDHWTMVDGELDWQPGTGANQTLGQLSIVHSTRCFFTAIPNN